MLRTLTGIVWLVGSIVPVVVVIVPGRRSVGGHTPLHPTFLHNRSPVLVLLLRRGVVGLAVVVVVVVLYCKGKAMRGACHCQPHRLAGPTKQARAQGRVFVPQGN